VLLEIGDEQPLTNGNFRKDAVDEMRRSVRHPPTTAGGAATSPLAGERDESVAPAGVAVDAQESVSQDGFNGTVYRSSPRGTSIDHLHASGSQTQRINREMADQIDAALNQLDDDDSLWTGVLEGCDSIFCAGSDLTCDGDYVTERGGERR
jgi:hypothetical protein